MLVLSRKFGEEVVIGNGVSVKVVEIRHGKVRLGFTAPPEVPVHRREVAEAIARGDGKNVQPNDAPVPHPQVAAASLPPTVPVTGQVES